MGCILSTGLDDGGTKQSLAQGNEVFVFVPGMRIPKGVDLVKALHGRVSGGMVERLSALRTRIEVMAAGEGLAPSVKPKRKSATQHGGSTVSDLQQAVEDYLPALLGLTREGSQLRDAVEFVWTNQEDAQQETVMSSSLYELLSMLHFLAMLGLSEANMLLIPKVPADGCQPKIADDNRKSTIESLLKVSGMLVYAKNMVIPQMSEEIQRKLPVDLKEDVLHALSMQALGQGVEIQLGLAIDNLKATLAVKRRLACEQVKYWKQAQESIRDVHIRGRCGAKHILFIKWKLTEAKTAAYYYHGLILGEGSEDNTHAQANACLEAADNFLKESQNMCADFCAAAPATRVPPLWGAMKYLTDKIPKDIASKVRINRDIYHIEKSPEPVPDVPDFPLALQAEEYELPSIDSSWELDIEVQSKAMLLQNDFPVEE